MGVSWACPQWCMWNWPIALLGQQVTANKFSLIACSVWTGLSKMPITQWFPATAPILKYTLNTDLFDWRDKIARLFHSSLQPSLSILDMPYSWGEWRKKWPLCFGFQTLQLWSSFKLGILWLKLGWNTKLFIKSGWLSKSLYSFLSWRWLVK